jgi:hypothetical protein
MIDLVVSVALLAAESPGPRGDNPGGSALFHRYGRSRRDAMTRTPAREGRVGRVSEFQDR